MRNEVDIFVASLTRGPVFRAQHGTREGEVASLAGAAAGATGLGDPGRGVGRQLVQTFVALGNKVCMVQTRRATVGRSFFFNPN
ncbi:hypothetical protein Amsp01_013400 [Amycolatopsis sp. NBRC 101858]|nr:hypothetical protein Amsp01_013400 [Amycolatopsis sp. NBRC 101858]